MAQATINSDYAIDTSGVYLWQYEEAGKLHAILHGTEKFFATAVTQFWQDFRDKIFNLTTATGFGLDLWGQILGVARPTYTYTIPDTDPEETATAKVSDEMYRRMLLGTLYKMNTNATMHDVNHFLEFIFPNRPFYTRNNLDMSFIVFALFVPTDEEKAVLRLNDFIPRPAGVLCNFAYYDPEHAQFFGFSADGEEEDLTQTYFGFKNELGADPETGGTFIF